MIGYTTTRDTTVLYADEPERVEKRLNRLGTDWSQARAIDREPTEPRTTAGSTLRLGAVARATLYFLLRYPGLVGDVRTEFPESRLPTLLAWHAGEPVSEYERQRNAAIAELQGDRNPLIDHPEWAQKIDFSGVRP